VNDNWNLIFLFIISAPCKKLCLSKSFANSESNKHKSIIIEISRPKFMNLQSLDLSI
jgi:hypothetical protein